MTSWRAAVPLLLAAALPAAAGPQARLSQPIKVSSSASAEAEIHSVALATDPRFARVVVVRRAGAKDAKAWGAILHEELLPTSHVGYAWLVVAKDGQQAVYDNGPSMGLSELDPGERLVSFQTEGWGEVRAWFVRGGKERASLCRGGTTSAGRTWSATCRVDPRVRGLVGAREPGDDGRTGYYAYLSPGPDEGWELTLCRPVTDGLRELALAHGLDPSARIGIAADEQLVVAYATEGAAQGISLRRAPIADPLAFSPPVRVEAREGERLSNPSLATVGPLVLLAYEVQAQAGPQVALVRSQDGGKTFSRPALLGRGRRPSLICVGAERVVLVADPASEEDRLLLVVSGDQGRTFPTALEVGAGREGEKRRPLTAAIAVDGADAFYLAWVDRAGEETAAWLCRGSLE